MPDQFQNRGKNKQNQTLYDSSDFLVGMLCDRNYISIEALAAGLLNYIK